MLPLTGRCAGCVVTAAPANSLGTTPSATGGLAGATGGAGGVLGRAAAGPWTLDFEPWTSPSLPPASPSRNPWPHFGQFTSEPAASAGALISAWQCGQAIFGGCWLVDIGPQGNRGGGLHHSNAAWVRNGINRQQRMGLPAICAVECRNMQFSLRTLFLVTTALAAIVWACFYWPVNDSLYYDSSFYSPASRRPTVVEGFARLVVWSLGIGVLLLYLRNVIGAFTYSSSGYFRDEYLRRVPRARNLADENPAERLRQERNGSEGDR